MDKCSLAQPEQKNKAVEIPQDTNKEKVESHQQQILKSVSNFNYTHNPTIPVFMGITAGVRARLCKCRARLFMQMSNIYTLVHNDCIINMISLEVLINRTPVSNMQ